MRSSLRASLLAVLALAGCRTRETPASAATVAAVLARATVQRVRTRDGVELRTWISLPSPLPVGGASVVLWRSPYRVSGGWSDESIASLATSLHARGYAFVLQDVRGRPESGGVFDVLRHEIDDGQDATRWIVRQPWSNGRIATMGASYDGFTALAAAVDNPHVRVVLSDDGTTDERSERIGGTFSTHTLSWLHLVETGTWLSDGAVRALTNALEPRGFDVELLGHEAPYWREALAHEAPSLWPADGSLEPRWADLCVPAIHVYSQTSGWNDPIDIWRGMRDHGCDARADEQFLVVTPDPHAHHASLLGTRATPVNELMLAALDAYIGDRPRALEGIPRVQWIQNGETCLRAATDWPAGSRERAFLLRARGPEPQGSLIASDDSRHDVHAASDVLFVDPAAMDPCDEARYPTLWYVSAPLVRTLTVAGAGRVELHLEADVPDTDVVVTLYDRDDRADEGEVFAGFGAVRARWRDGAASKALVPGEPVLLTIPLTAIAHEFRAGHALVLSIAPGRCGLLENPQTAEPVTAQTHRRAGTLRIACDGARRSRIVLPVVE